MITTTSALARYIGHGERLLDEAGTVRTWEELRHWRVDRDQWSLEAADALTDAVGRRTAWWFLRSVTPSRMARSVRGVLRDECERLEDGLAVLRATGAQQAPGSRPYAEPAGNGARITR